MGMALAQQMMTTMNTAMNSMQVAGVNAGTTGQTGCAMRPYNNPQWYAVVDGRQLGPLNEAELEKLVVRKDVTDDTLMWRPGMKGWQMACNIPEVNKLMILNR